MLACCARQTGPGGRGHKKKKKSIIWGGKGRTGWGKLTAGFGGAGTGEPQIRKQTNCKRERHEKRKKLTSDVRPKRGTVVAISRRTVGGEGEMSTGDA